MRGRMIGVAALTMVLLAALVSAASARECRDVPFDFVMGPGYDGHVPAGEVFPIFLFPDEESAGSIRDLVVTIGETRYPVASPGEDQVIEAIAPAATGTFEIWFSYRLEGSPDGEVLECADETGWNAVAVPADSTFGTDGTRVDGVWRVQLMPRGFSVKPYRLRWKLTPECDYGACDTVLHERDGGRYRLKAKRSTYTSQKARTTTVCFARDGRRVPGGFVGTHQHRFEVERLGFIKRTLAHRGARILGVTTIRFTPTPKGRAAGCRAQTIRYTIRGVRIADR